MKYNLILTLNQINNDMWCWRTYWKADRYFQQVKDQLTEQEARKLEQLLTLTCDPDCPDSHWADYWAKAKVSDYIKELIDKYSKKGK